MTPIDYIRIDAEILNLQVCDKAKFLLGLVKSFNNKGLMISNQALAKLLCCSENNIVKLLQIIRPYIRIENPKSRYRKIFYTIPNYRVETELHNPKLLSRNNLLGNLVTSKQSQITDITKRTKETKTSKLEERMGQTHTNYHSQ